MQWVHNKNMKIPITPPKDNHNETSTNVPIKEIHRHTLEPVSLH